MGRRGAVVGAIVADELLRRLWRIELANGLLHGLLCIRARLHILLLMLLILVVRVRIRADVRVRVPILRVLH